jgi:hypothetical protein
LLENIDSRLEPTLTDIGVQTINEGRLKALVVFFPTKRPPRAEESRVWKHRCKAGYESIKIGGRDGRTIVDVERDVVSAIGFTMIILEGSIDSRLRRMNSEPNVV